MSEAKDGRSEGWAKRKMGEAKDGGSEGRAKCQPELPIGRLCCLLTQVSPLISLPISPRTTFFVLIEGSHIGGRNFRIPILNVCDRSVKVARTLITSDVVVTTGESAG